MWIGGKTMEMNDLLELAQSILTLLVGGLAIYFKASAKAQTKGKQIQQAIAEITAKAIIFIKEAEEKYQDVSNMGGTKFNEVVDRLFGLVPPQLQMIITREMIESIVQSTFDEIEEYVRLQLDNAIRAEVTD